MASPLNYTNYNIASSFTRPSNTTGYTSGQLVSNSTASTAVVPLSWTLPENAMIRRVRLIKSNASTTNASFNLQLYSALPSTISNGDGSTWSTSGATSDMGSFTITCTDSFSDGAVGIAGPNAGFEINCYNSPNIIYGLLVAQAAYTPVSSEVFTIILEALTD